MPTPTSTISVIKHPRLKNKTSSPSPPSPSLFKSFIPPSPNAMATNPPALRASPSAYYKPHPYKFSKTFINPSTLCGRQNTFPIAGKPEKWLSSPKNLTVLPSLKCAPSCYLRCSAKYGSALSFAPYPYTLPNTTSSAPIKSGAFQTLAPKMPSYKSSTHWKTPRNVQKACTSSLLIKRKHLTPQAASGASPLLGNA